MIRRVFESFLRRCAVCAEQEGQYIEQLVICLIIHYLIV